MMWEACKEEEEVASESDCKRYVRAQNKRGMKIFQTRKLGESTKV